jgi:pimeloyl-ACP methyl ester carboxylesterase
MFLTALKLVAPHATGETIKDCGHFLPEERPEAVVRHLEKLREFAANR